MKNIIYACKGSAEGDAGLQILLKYSEFEIKACVMSDYSATLENICRENNIPLYTAKTINRLLLDLREVYIDLLISFTYTKRIPMNLIKKAVYAINVHPAPLPYYKGRGCSFHAIYNNEKKWGATVHILNENFDEGDIVHIRWFDIDASSMYGYELRNQTWQVALVLLEDTIVEFIKEGTIQGVTQEGIGVYYSQKDMDSMKRVFLDDSAEQIDRKIRAYWFPPNEGAYIEIAGKRYQLINQDIVNDIQNIRD